MNHRHRKVLHGIFSHPLHHNLDPKAVEHLLAELGADLHPAGSGAMRITLNGAQDSVHLGEHSLAGDQVMRLRKLLGAAGIEPDRDFPL